MLAKMKWQIKTIAILEKVFEERCRQFEIHGDAMDHLPDGTGPDTRWLQPITTPDGALDAHTIEGLFRNDYQWAHDEGSLTRLHLVREELAEAFELDGDDPEFVTEILQVAALCVQWAEIKS